MGGADVARKHVLRGLAGVAVFAGMLALALVPARANAATVGAQLSTTGVQSSHGGGGVLSINAGDTVVFSAGSPPTRVMLVPGYTVTVDSAGLPGAPSSVRLSGGKTFAVTFDSAGSYPLSWTPSNALGTIHLQKGEYTSATVEVAAPPAQGSSPPESSSATSTPPAGSTSTPGTSGPSATSSAQGLVAGQSGSTSPTATGSAASTAVASGSGTRTQTAPTTPGDLSSAPPDQVSATTLYADVAHKASRPTGLAIVSIVALALVMAIYAFLYLGGASPLRGARRR